MPLDSHRFLDFASRKVMQAWAARHDDRPFEQTSERRNPWWGVRPTAAPSRE